MIEFRCCGTFVNEPKLTNKGGGSMCRFMMRAKDFKDHKLYPIIAFNKTADLICSYAQKGTVADVIGLVNLYKKDETSFPQLSLIVGKIDFITNYRSKRSESDYSEPEQVPTFEDGLNDYTDDIPF